MRQGDALPDADLTTAGVLERLRASGLPLRAWGTAVDGSPMLSAQAGGRRQPPVLIAAGVHAGESAGVHAALHLLRELDTDHEVHIVPLRDPFGFAGVNHGMSHACGRAIHIQSHAEALQCLQSEGQLLWKDEVLHLFKAGDFGFVWLPQGSAGFYEAIEAIGEVNRKEPGALRPLWGKRVLLVDPDAGYAGAEEMRRCWHGVMSRSGEWLHLNRFFGRADAPPEVSALQRLVDELHPGLVCDLQEDRVGGFWLACPESHREREGAVEVARAGLEAIRGCGLPVHTYDRMQAEDHPDLSTPGLLRPEPKLPGMTWMQIQVRGEGDNLLTYAARKSLCLGVESPMERSLSERVEGTVRCMRAIVRSWEQRVCN